LACCVSALIPGWGNVISGGVAAAGAHAIGEAAIAYFIGNKTLDEAKDAMRLASRRVKANRRN
jgi:hypothetical protein